MSDEPPVNLEAGLPLKRRMELCKLAIEPFGFEVLDFWIDDDDYGVAKVKHPDGSTKLWSQNPKQKQRPTQ